jgi:mRNA interferase RelE/StbE
MPYTIEFTASARREFLALERQVQRRISAKMTELAKDPIPPSARKYQGADNHWRIRIGDYRVIYRIERSRLVIVIVRVGHRREVYR